MDRVLFVHAICLDLVKACFVIFKNEDDNITLEQNFKSLEHLPRGFELTKLKSTRNKIFSISLRIFLFNLREKVKKFRRI